MNALRAKRIGLASLCLGASVVKIPSSIDPSIDGSVVHPIALDDVRMLPEQEN
jgi:hypothetical protein